jgi:DNA-binding transcriptional LysR family regulator
LNQIPGGVIFDAVDRKNLTIDFRHFESFKRVADLKSFSKAAEDLFLTQPTVSGHILALERSLSIRFFDRTARDIRLTQAGEIFYRYASEILSSRKDLLNALSDFSKGIKGELALGASTIPGEYILPRLMGEFRKEHPRFMLSLKIADTERIVLLLLQGSVELGLIGARMNHPLLQYEKYEEDEIILICRSREFQGKRIDFENLLGEPWILREEGSGTQMAVEKALRKKGKTLKHLNQVTEMGSTSAVKEGVKAGLGLAFLPKRAVQEELNQGVLYQVRVGGIETIVRQIYIVLRRGKTLSPAGTAFLRYLSRNRLKVH